MSTFYTPEFYKNVAGNIPENQTIYLYVSDNRDIDATMGSLKYHNSVLYNIVWGKKVTPVDTFHMIKRIDWVNGKVFTKYDDTNPTLMNEDYYCINSGRAVYKCLDNNNNAPSTIEPQSLDMVPFKTSDGYVWKFMYRLTIEHINERSFNDFIPVIEDEDVVSSSVPGTIDNIFIEDPGVYQAVDEGFVVSKVSNYMFRIQDTASGINDYYNGSAFYIEAGPSSGSVAQIVNYFSNNVGRYVELNVPLSSVTNLSQYSIAPYIEIIGDGEDAKARAVMNEDGSIQSVEILNRGSDYTYAQVTPITSEISSHSDGELRGIISPLKGHGHDPKKELNSSTLLFSVDIKGNEVSTITTPVEFDNYGLVSGVLNEDDDTAYTDDTFNNLVLVETTALNGDFAIGDIVYLDTDANVRAKIISKDSQDYQILYEGKLRFAENQTIRNSDGVMAFILDITNPTSTLYKSDILSYDNTDLLVHTDTDKTTFNILIGTKPQ